MTDLNRDEPPTAAIPWYHPRRLLASKKTAVLLFGISGCFFSSTFSYFNGSITTMEKRFKMPSKTTGIISIGNDITKLLTSVVLNYYASRGHRPRWMSLGLYCVSTFCFLNALPHFLYGPGEDALQLTVEYGKDLISNGTQLDTYSKKDLCDTNDTKTCNQEDGNIVPPIIWFVSQFISGMGSVLFYSMGYSYLDDNIKKSKSPAMIASLYVIRMFHSALGYGIASICLKMYIAPNLTPTIDNVDPRWLGAWWIGWLVFGGVLTVCAFFVSNLPKALPRAVERNKDRNGESEEVKPSFKDLLATVRRILTNKVYVYKQLGSVVNVIAMVPFRTFMPKYIETQYRKSASAVNFITGSVGLIFSAIGITLSGFLVQRFKPKATTLAVWNATVDAIKLVSVFSYLFLGCGDVDAQNWSMAKADSTSCADCQCDLVKFSPVCAVESTTTFISACHAGCTEKSSFLNRTITYTKCSCIQDDTVTSGSCPVDCHTEFLLFVAIICINKLFSSLATISNFLISIRCVEERDKTVSLGISLSTVSLFSLIPAPIFIGHIIDSTCLVWGKTCKGTGNCWLFDSILMRQRLVYVSTFFLALKVVFDFGIWRGVKSLKVFGEEQDEERDKVEMNNGN